MTVGVPVVAYRGPDAASLAERWNGPDRPFVLRPWETDSSAETDDQRPVDCVVLEARADRDVSAWVEAVGERLGAVPIIVVRVGQITDLESAIPDGVTSQFTVAPEVDRVALLSKLASVVEEHVSARSERSILESLLANVPLSLYAKDRDGRHVAVSDEMIDMIGPPYIENQESKRHHHPADVLGKTDFDLYGPELAVESTDAEQSVIETGEPVEDRVEESYGERGMGSSVVTSKVPWYGPDGSVRGTIGVTRDISERKQYEHQLKRQNERLRRLATMVSHDIRNPLSVAVGRLAIARETGDPEHFAAVERAHDRIDALVSDIITVMRQGEPATDLDAVPLADLVRDVFEEHATAGVRLTVSTDATIYVDSGRVRQLFEELFENAIEHGRDADGVMTITVGDLPDGTGFFVADDGVGLSADHQEKLLKPGLSGSNTSTLGLALVATIADAHNWSINLTESEEGGARFEFHGVRNFDASSSGRRSRDA
ncbi:Adaptive-response sensory-kinase protein [Halorhabdus tiamatea SARL4B]|uniref:histidine kinase n=1 Tax=Halorhabdus tiamatea SARL4B TaxID=1033806 RepID=F7PQ25_9EURY|nr:PAS domain-containing sensor histidine kinase [Halorhabdus tiamatea]ERJ07247.1 Adaptive-response sensory-kinase protein [Halorhabdus tiamatea SARL4B]CCQ34159.1 PAS/PAC sensor signal transduction histidine kinase [Halorhabdus tiamatea SARL4B]